MTRVPFLALVACALACDDDPFRGSAGESCTRRDDCDVGLRCVERVCAEPGDAGAEPAAGEEGDACASRRDCEVGLICVANACMPQSAGVEGSGRASGLGESCRATNDCATELSCVSGACARVSLALPHTGKECHRVECAEDVDCCAGFVPNENCPAYMANCEADPVFCNTYRSLCECNQRCVEELCTASAPGCTESSECTSQQTPFCVEGACRQCERDANCPGEGTQCVEGVCTAACQIDEQCPPLHACQDGACVEVGCQSDRECVFLTGDASSACLEGECAAPCDTDSDCASEGASFEVCLEGACVFVGCETDGECRALLRLASQQDSVQAVCR